MNKFNIGDMEDKMLKICDEILDEKWDSSCDISCGGVECENCFFGDTFEVCDNRNTEMFKYLAKSYKDKHSNIIKESNMEKTFKGWEIMKMIAEGELKNGDIVIENDLKNGDIVIENDGSWAYTVLQNCLVDGRNVKEFDSKLESGNSNFCNDNDTYIIKKSRMKCTFEEAFKAYEEGKEIESCVDGEVYNKLKEDKDMDKLFNASQIRGMWYINNK